MRPVIEYFLCVVATPLLSEFPLHILELVDQKDGITPTHESISYQKDSEHGARHSSDFNSAPHCTNDNNDLTGADASGQRNGAYRILLAIVAVPHLYMLWRVIPFTCKMQISRHESLLF
ncbi:uncharacterized protein PV07_11943 [Cladophialophora immunda]|uniref:Uncharacterized protein n=1 Tax=Cladophialophora immunda TaxID=569365 RepID=A0A0D1Z7Y6_9EURO|nr:uncharacterized protein PV07_11943 [Cladophialophora immunda]KIW23766.1 hypothetical protein PV07_11943 [Cladophialophora immunda]OQV07955.1 hypothetical protein CLAIMM_12307 [Cladophialophora immunda]